MNFLTAFCLILCAASASKGENIVFFFGVSSYSHRVPAWPLAEALAEKGHNVTFISPFPSKSPNPKIFDYVPKKLKEWVESWGDLENVFENRKSGDWKSDWVSLPLYGIMMCEEIYKDQEYIDWVKSSKVDLVLIDALSNDCGYGLAHYWDAKVIIFQTTSAFSFFTETHGLPVETSWLPIMETYYSPEMTFKQRIVNGLVPVAWHYYRKWSFFPTLEEITREKLEIEVPRFEDIERNVSLVFLNTHYGEEFPRSLPPHVIPIGGIAYKAKRSPLPKDLDDFLKKGDGFIYMSFGTYGDFLQFSPEVQQAFIGAMRDFPQMQFVWKVSNESFLKEFPKKNVYISKWMPQQDILAHPKIKAFITHSGLLGIQEAVYNAVPLISFPLFGEQDYNAARVHRREYGIRLELTTVTQPQIEDAFNRILNDPKYRNNMKKVSNLFVERPQKPLDTALWWTEFVIRHSKEDLEAIRPTISMSQPWWMRRQLDVWITVFATVAFLMSWIMIIAFKLLRYVCSRNSQVGEKQRKKKVQ